MLRARHLTSLGENPRERRGLFSAIKHTLRNKYDLIENVVANEAVRGVPFDVERGQEIGSHGDREFVRLVAKVIEIREEDIFRLLVMYL